jgi:hypothetical protein
MRLKLRGVLPGNLDHSPELACHALDSDVTASGNSGHDQQEEEG